jgi:hypothetical protein
LKLLPHPFPHRGHIGEKSKVAERSALRGKLDIAACQRPAIARQRLREVPAPAAVLIRTGDEFARRIPFGQPRRPHRLRLGADEAIRAITLELTTMAAVDQAVITPAITSQDQRLRDKLCHQPRAVA